MSTCVFVGPTLRREEVAAICAADCLPPAAQGDVYRAARRGARSIGIIDGYFSGAPSVWHKEILWALSQGIRVFGSASMGALRAAELHRFGMRGVGHIFEAFRDGTLEDDDEVAVVHGPAELGYIAMSEPMVNIRATLARAEAEGVVSGSGRRRLEDFSKSLFFPHRTWPAVTEGAPARGVSEAEVETFRAWLPRGRVDQKRADALAMLAAMGESGPRHDPSPVGWRFEETHFWDDMVAQFADKTTPGGDPQLSRQSAILEEVRLEGGHAYTQARCGALLRLLAESEGNHWDVEATPYMMRAALTSLRSARGLFSRAELEVLAGAERSGREIAGRTAAHPRPNGDGGCFLPLVAGAPPAG